MKYTALMVSLVFISIMATAQQSVDVIQFPQSFKLDARLLPDYELFPMNEEMQQHGFKENPGVITDKDMMKKVVSAWAHIPAIDAIYYEIYSYNDDSDAGVQVYNFSSGAAAEQYLADQYAQSNYAVLTFLEHYLIEVWCDDGKNGGEKLKKLIAYYEAKLGAQLQTLGEDTLHQMDVEAAAEDAYEEIAEDAVTDAAGK